MHTFWYMVIAFLSGLGVAAFIAALCYIQSLECRLHDANQRIRNLAGR